MVAANGTRFLRFGSDSPGRIITFAPISSNELLPLGRTRPIIRVYVVKRFPTSKVRPGAVELDPAQARHARDVLRLPVGAEVELFDAEGAVGVGRVTQLDPVTVDVESVREPLQSRLTLTVASAVPKAARAEWMVEKLSELGVSELILLDADRSVVVPEGRNKIDRWNRIAEEAAKQSRRAGVMGIEGPRTVDQVLTSHASLTKWCLSTQGHCQPLGSLLSHLPTNLLMFIGPEGGWTEKELARFTEAGATPVSLTDTVLRIETAAIASAAVVMSSAIRSS